MMLLNGKDRKREIWLHLKKNTWVGVGFEHIFHWHGFVSWLNSLLVAIFHQSKD